MFDLIKPVYAEQVVGSVTNILPYGDIGASGKGLTLFLSNIIRLVFVIAGILALVNFFVAGFQYMMAGGDSKRLSAAWSRIWQSLLGLIIVVSAFVIASLIGVLFFGNGLFILQPALYGPN